MARQMFAGFVLVAFVNFLMGCSSTSVEKIPPQGAQGSTETIADLVLVDGTMIKCRPRSMKFYPSRPGIRGKLVTNQVVFVPLESLRQCRISPPKSIAVSDIDTAHIVEVVLGSYLLVSFQEPGARFDRQTAKIAGKTVDGHAVSYKPELLKSIRSERPDTISMSDLELHQEQPVYEVVNANNLVVTFDSAGGYLEQNRAMFSGTDEWGKILEIPADSVLYVEVTKSDPAKAVLITLGVVVGIAAIVLLIALASKQSCPFVYSFDGQHFVFDAEPLGGAISPGLARTDISRLDHVQPVDGEYRLLVRNEVPETQHIDKMNLLVVDHPPNASVYPDLEGKFHGFRNIYGATAATDEKGMSLMKFLHASDNISWQTHLPSASKVTNDPVRHTLTITLPKQAGTKKAWLITNIGTSTWGSNMIRKTVEYRGNSAEAWLKSLTPGSQSFVQMAQYIEKEELYQLKAWVKEGESWNQESVISGQGPFISEDRVYPIDVSNVVGDSLVLRFNPPKGFWTFDYIGVSYEEPLTVPAVTVGPMRAQDQHENSILDSLKNADGRDYVMPEVGDWASVSFLVPGQVDGTARSVYLETSGYYELHLPKDKPDQLARLYSMALHPGEIVKIAMEEFRSWQSELQAGQNQFQAE